MSPSTRIQISKIEDTYPKAMTNQDLIAKVADILKPYGYGETTLLASALCCDEVNRELEKDFHSTYGDHFSMGGLAGFAFGGLTSFGAMAHHIPAGGSCLVLYGPHVGIDSDGNVGKINRRGRISAGACCGSATAAAGFVKSVREGKASGDVAFPDDVVDAQQHFVGTMLLPYGERLEKAPEPAAELPLALFDAQNEMMEEIVSMGCGEVHGPGRIALLGGVQINTPQGMPDYFLPLRFEIRDNSNKLIDKLLWT